MSRYIDADDAIEKYAHYGIPHMWDATDLEYILDEMPAIDIVRCKECEHWDRERAKRNSIQFMGYCILHSGYCSGDKYCAWGERREQ